MPIYISRGKFTTDAVKGMLAKPENQRGGRRQSLQELRRQADRLVLDVRSA